MLAETRRGTSCHHRAGAKIVRDDIEVRHPRQKDVFASGLGNLRTKTLFIPCSIGKCAAFIPPSLGLARGRGKVQSTGHPYDPHSQRGSPVRQSRQEKPFPKGAHKPVLGTLRVYRVGHLRDAMAGLHTHDDAGYR
jgi:hypothetical protein